jgi:aspartyl/asparaginyl beta-hydroxylase/uncharacterized protein DUF6817
MLATETTAVAPSPRAFAEVEALLRRATAEALPHARGRSLYDHLLGTRSILRAWSQPDQLCNAGALHSVYGTDRYRRGLISPLRRKEIQELVGQQTERLVYLFCSIDRQHLYRQLASMKSIPAEGLTIERHDSAEIAVERLSQDEVKSLLILYMANQAEQSTALEGRPGINLTMISNLGIVAATAGGGIAPPIFAGCQVVVPGGREGEAAEAYGCGLSAFSQNREAALRELSRAAELNPWVAEPAIWLAYFHLGQGNAVTALRWIEQARRTLSQWGTPWDKRLNLEEWSWLIDFVARLGAKPSELGPLPAPEDQNLPLFVEKLRKRDWTRVYLGSRMSGNELDAPAEELSGPQDEVWSQRLYRYVCSFSRSPVESNRKVYPGLRAQPWPDPGELVIARELERNFDEIREEILSLEGSHFTDEAESIPRTGNWKVLFINERGRRNEAMRAHCPVTCRTIESDSMVRSLPGMSYVSKLTPGTHVAPHYAPTNLRLRLHLGIRIPAGNCGLRVEGQTRQWTEGKCLLFDDSLLHEVWNHTSEERVVLIVDIWHPELTPREIAVLEGLQGYAMMEGAALNAYWTANERARSASGSGR